MNRNLILVTEDDQAVRNLITTTLKTNGYRFLTAADGDEAVLQAMEPGETPQRMSYSVRKDGTLSGDLADREQLRALKAYVFRVLAELVEEIASGNVDPNPYTRGTSHSACDYCPYGAVCHKEQVPGRRNYKTMTAQRFWEEIEKERNRHGR